MKKAFFLIALATALLALGFTAQPAMAVGQLGGAVVDADDNPVAGAQVMVMGLDHRRGQRPFMGRGESGEDGTFMFDNVPAGRYMVSAMAREHVGARAEAEVRDGEATRVRLVLAVRGGGGGGGGGEDVPTGSVSGTVSDVDGNPIAGARVMLMPARLVNHRGHGGHRGNIAVQTDENGQFSAADLRIGVWVVTAMHREFGMGRTRAEVVADQNTEVEITLQRRHR